MKNLTILFALMIMSTLTFAQAREVKLTNYPYWTISKDVQRIQFRNEVFKPAAITIGNAVWSGKGVTRIAANKTQSNFGLMRTTGTPSFVISKGVARVQARKK